LGSISFRTRGEKGPAGGLKLVRGAVPEEENPMLGSKKQKKALRFTADHLY